MNDVTVELQEGGRQDRESSRGSVALITANLGFGFDKVGLWRPLAVKPGTNTAGRGCDMALKIHFNDIL